MLVIKNNLIRQVREDTGDSDIVGVPVDTGIFLFNISAIEEYIEGVKY
jgi:hypothetical protein